MKFLIVALAVCSAIVATQGRSVAVDARSSVGLVPVQPRPQPPPSPLQPNSLRTSSEVYGAKGADDVPVPILKFETNVGVDTFNYAYETGNGIAAQEEGVLKKIEDKQAIVVTGSFKYTAPDGTPVLLTYTADENGFQPQSNLLPVAPPIPEAILRALAYQAARAEPSTNPH